MKNETKQGAVDWVAKKGKKTYAALHSLFLLEADDRSTLVLIHSEQVDAFLAAGPFVLCHPTGRIFRLKGP